MVHSVFFVLGADELNICSAIKKYVMMYGEGNSDDYFNVYNWNLSSEGVRNVMSFSNQKVDSDEFCSGMENEFNVMPKEAGVLRTEEEEPHFFSVLYNQTVTLSRPSDSSSLYLYILLPLYDRNLWDEARLIMKSIDEINQSYKVNIIGLSDDFSQLLSGKNDELMSVNLSKALKSNVSYVCSSIKQNNARCKQHFIMLQNRTSNGVSLNLDKDSLVGVLGEIGLACAENNPSVFNVSSNDVNDEVDGIGLSVLRFDKYYFIQYLLRKAYLKVLARENVMQKEVDVNKVSQIAQKSLQENVDIYTRFYQKIVAPMVKAGKGHDDIIAEITPMLAERFENVSSNIQAFISDENLSLPEKQAVLAQLLGEDDQLLKGYQFNPKQLTIDDCHKDVLQLYIDNNNKSIERTVDDDGKVVVYPNVLDCPQKENGDIYLPLDDLKNLRIKIKESSNYIREKSKELDELDKHLQKTEMSEVRLSNNGFTYGEVTYKLFDGEETPLQEEYEPVGVPKRSVDLRELFPPVKDQGALGACSAFSMVSIYEYILKKTSRAENLSERFVYYNVLSDSGDMADSGASLFSVVDSITRHGVCADNLCRYDVEKFQVKPSGEAYMSATSHKIKCAKNVKLCHKDITSALSEGFPVAISLKIYDSFGENRKGFIYKPSEAEVENGNSGNHAMVICGYSEEEKVYIVRNSWGEKFGDKGYCYIPFSYVEDESFANFACIVTAINDGEEVKGASAKNVVSFNKTDIDIRYSILRILVDEEKLLLSERKKRYDSLRHDYELLLQALSNNGKRNNIIEKSKSKLQSEISVSHKEYNSFVANDMPLELSDYKRNGWKDSILISLVSVIAVVAWFVCNEYVEDWLSNGWMWFTTAIGVLGLILLVMFVPYKIHHYRVKRNELEDVAQAKMTKLRNDQCECDVIHLRLFVAGMVIDKLVGLHKELSEKYLVMKSYVGNLSLWYEEELNMISHMNQESKVPFIQLLNNDMLDSYFDSNGDELINNVYLYKYLNDYELTEQGISAYKTRIKNILIEALHKPLEGFDMYNYLKGVKVGAFMPLPKIAQFLTNMESCSVPFLQVNCTNLKEVSEVRAKMLCVSAADDGVLSNYRNECAQDFVKCPDFVRCSSVFKIVLLQRSSYKLNEIVF